MPNPAQVADLYFAGLRMMGFLFVEQAEKEAQQMLANHVGVALTTHAAEVERQVWEQAATLAASRHFSQARAGIDNQALWELQEECQRRATPPGRER